MELRFYGATGDTTGSCHLLSANGASVLLDGRRFTVRASVTPLLGFSSHADREGLLAAHTPHAPSARALFLVHGENDQRDPLARTLKERGFARVETPDDPRLFAF